MSPTPKVQSGSPRRQRLKKNRNAEAGMRNRENGLFKKTNTWHHYYGGDILIFIKRPDGRIKGYESRPKLLQEFSKLPIPAHEIRGPDDIDTHNSPRRKVSVFTGKHSYLLQLKFIKFIKFIKFTSSIFSRISRIEPSIIWTNLPTLIAAIATTIAIAKKTPKSLIMSVQANF
ncbi:hypothetical protein RAB80_004240 [Fusarium oxysporum f. sp. vasinfectum]|nr:hypothetical protein RAB80_004240 [Fusarium oxysporum f. sp. vasinfectum]